MFDRRKFIKTIGRGMILTGLSAVTGYLILKDDSQVKNACDFDFICAKCRKHSSCSLPEAKKHAQKSPTK